MRAPTDFLESDYETLFIKDPLKFFENLIINVMYAAEGEVDEVINRQKKVFERWLLLYNYHYRETIAKNLETKYSLRLESMLKKAERDGRIAALSELPMRRNMLANHVDLNEVAKLLRDLKG